MSRSPTACAWVLRRCLPACLPVCLCLSVSPLTPALRAAECFSQSAPRLRIVETLFFVLSWCILPASPFRQHADGYEILEPNPERISRIPLITSTSNRNGGRGLD
ncbi:hypothetical protein BS50DRAFT_568399 [Corynespora cassiicola Philippines]|uniref:Uncharacterized protein n=1 Tax=Corynespora cassiicola Philippines TaxID=1448308 RepID=A0A2T2P635_CORCC|nr:hypothetical protein BS50DRAFT_568399 [Corynespora cassiicola Philippines]